MSLRPSIRFLLRSIPTRVFPPLLYDQAGSLKRRRDRKKINPADAQNLSSQSPFRKTEKPLGSRRTRAKEFCDLARERVHATRFSSSFFLAPPPPPHFCALPVWTTTTEKSIVFRALKRRRKTKKTKEKDHPKNKREHHHHHHSSKSERTYLLDGWVFQRFRRFRARAFRLRGIRSRRLGDDFRGGGCNGVHDFFFFISLFFVMMMNEFDALSKEQQTLLSSKQRDKK